MAASLITYPQLIELHPDGINIRAYQRRYVWGQHRQGTKDSVTTLTECLIQAYSENSDYFLQALTFDGDDLVDGQQRVTYVILLMRLLGYERSLAINYECRQAATSFANGGMSIDVDDQDVYFMRRTIKSIDQTLTDMSIDRDMFRDFLLEHLHVLHITIPDNGDAVAIYKMMNGAKTSMLAPDIIKAEIMRLASDSSQPYSTSWDISGLRSHYANEWDSWVRWWSDVAIREYFDTLADEHPLDLLLRLSMREACDTNDAPYTFEEFRLAVALADERPSTAAKLIFRQIRTTHKRIEQAYNNPASYNRIRAVLLLQRAEERLRFMRRCFVDCSAADTVDDALLERFYRLSFLGMSVSEIVSGVSAAERFDDLLASLSMADVYHSDAKRDVFNLLLRLNIDEDIKLGRRFDFAVWSNRSLEHIFSKSKVWHTDNEGNVLDGNDNILRGGVHRKPGYMPRVDIVNHDGTQLSEHCIGNLVLLYGQNNAEFGNTGFEAKKAMFLTPGDATVFRSRNLLHTVCVFAGNSWDNKSIVENYNLTLKNLKLYYGFL